MNPAVVSLKGYADVNRELLTSVYFLLTIVSHKMHKINCEMFFSFIFGQSITTITIYLIVLLQFKLSLIANQLPQAFQQVAQMIPAQN